jgi:hypothetical protein
VSTWERVERGETDRAHASRGVRQALATIEEVMGYLDHVPYGALHEWASRPRGRRTSPIDLAHRPGGITQLLQQLRANGDGVS